MFQLDFTKLFSYFVYDQSNPLSFTTPFFLVLFTMFMAVFMVIHKHHRSKIIYLTLFSLFFYYKSSGLYFLLLLLSAVSDFSLALLLHKASRDVRKKLILVVSVVLNLSLLSYFKYTNFFISLFNIASGHEVVGALDIFLPVGISFFTFQSISYIIDVYRKEVEPLTNLLEYCFFISFFPQLVAGPILKAKDFLPQIKMPNIVSTQDFNRGLFLIVCGLIKKAVISDYISTNFVDRIFDNPALYSGVENLLGVYGYAIQIYCDFSGYTDIAIGIALLLGYTLPVNFDSPYISASITEFWRRWHISLSTWLKEYLYIPLGGNRKGKLRQYFNLFITMLLGGLWHGASINFIIWGALHGTALGVEKFIKESLNLPKNEWIRIAGVFLIFNFVCFCWIFFRANDFESAKMMIHQIVFQFHGSVVTEVVTGYYRVFVAIGLAFVLHAIPAHYNQTVIEKMEDCPLLVKSLLLSIIILLVAQVQSSEIHPFIYFQF